MFDAFGLYAIIAEIVGAFARFSSVQLVILVIGKVEIYSCAVFGGVYLLGGIVPRRLRPLFGRSDFRSQFEEKERLSNFNVQIPSYVITAKQPGILGVVAYLRLCLLA